MKTVLPVMSRHPAMIAMANIGAGTARICFPTKTNTAVTRNDAVREQRAIHNSRRVTGLVDEQIKPREANSGEHGQA